MVEKNLKFDHNGEERLSHLLISEPLFLRQPGYGIRVVRVYLETGMPPLWKGDDADNTYQEMVGSTYPWGTSGTDFFMLDAHVPARYANSASY